MTAPAYPREDVCSVCGIHLGWSLDPSMDDFMLGKCEEHATPDPWNDDTIQFPRLLAEIMATVSFTARQRADLQDATDLSWEDILSIFDRAQNAWDDIKAQTKP